MTNPNHTAAAFAQSLVDSTAPIALPDPLPFPPLEILIKLHSIVAASMFDDFAQARHAADMAWRIVERAPDDPLLRAQAHWSNGSAIMFIPAYQDALDHFDAALRCYREACARCAPALPARDVRTVEIMRVFCLTELGRYTEAQQAAEAARAFIAQQPVKQQAMLRLKLLINESGLMGDIGAYTQMLALTEEAIALARETDEIGELAHAWVNQGYAYIALGRLDEADSALKSGSSLAVEAEDWLTVARAQCNRAVLLRAQGRLFEALTTLRTAERGFQQAEGEAATIAQEAAPIFAQLRQIPEALHAARRAADGFAAQAMPAYSARAFLEGVLLNITLGRLRDARALLQQATKQARRAHAPILDAELALAKAHVAAVARPPLRQIRAAQAAAMRATALLGMHGLAAETARGTLALAALDRALGNTAAAIDAYYTLAEHADPHIRIEALIALGALLPAIAARPLLEQAARIAITQRRRLPTEELLARFSSETSTVHLQLATCRLALDDLPGMLAAIWEAKGGALLDLRAASHQDQGHVRPILEQAKAEIARQQALAYSLQRRAQGASDEGRHTVATQLSGQAQVAGQAVLAAEQALTDALRSIGRLDGQMDIPAVAHVQALLSTDTVILEFAAWEGQIIVLLVQGERQIIFKQLGSSQAVCDLLNRLSLLRCQARQRTTTSTADLEDVLTLLGTLLLAPLRIHISTIAHLVIAPWDILAHVPWAALLDALAWPVETVTLTPCGALWGVPPPAPVAPVGVPRLLGYRSTGTRELIYVAQEIAAIQASLPDAIVSATATIADLCATPAPTLLHIAAHGHTNTAAPLCSTLELADEQLMLLEIHRLDLRGTQLVTLSACETSVRPNHGDMALALAGAFLCAGAHGVIASLWPVNDAVTAILMEQLYIELSASLDPALALARARRTIRAVAPFDAAAFQFWAGCAPNPTRPYVPTEKRPSLNSPTEVA